MLASTFIHLSGVGAQTERSLWKRGYTSWKTLLPDIGHQSIGSAPRDRVKLELEESIVALAEGRHQFFAQKLRRRDTWRAYENFKESCVFLDIETDGGMGPDSITTIGLYDGKEFQCLIKGDNLESFRDIITHYSMIVTFFGTGFDLPVLAHRFPDVSFDHIHLDLCPTLRDLGFRGGLKKIERIFNIQRSPETDGLTGFDAVKLWRRHLMGSEQALERLIAYNREDVVNLKTLADAAYGKLRRTVGLNQYSLDLG